MGGDPIAPWAKWRADLQPSSDQARPGSSLSGARFPETALPACRSRLGLQAITPSSTARKGGGDFAGVIFAAVTATAPVSAESFIFPAALNFLTYLLTFNCYGTHLHGAPCGSVDRTRGDLRGGYREVSTALHAYEQKRMLDKQYAFDLPGAKLALSAIQEVCSFRG